MGTSCRLSLLGTPTVELAGRSTALAFERRTQLVVSLALRRTWVTRTELASMLWPEQASKLAHANLRKTLFRLPGLPWAAAIEAQGAALRFEADTDVSAFELALREQRLPDAVAACRGELLAGFDDGQSEPWTRWITFERERLRLAWRGAMLSLLAAQTDAAAAIALSTRLLDADPLDEAALREHMRWLATSGQGAAARQAYRRFAEGLAEDLGLEPGAELRALHDSLTTLAPPPVAAAALPSAPSALPDDGFVGRSIELQRITSLLERAECRLLCLIGPGGVGKTRLAHRALPELAPRFVDGALFIELDGVTSAAAFADRLAQALGLARAQRQDPLAPVIDALRDRPMLLVLDNFEQLAEEAGPLEKLLQDCARVKVLATSRARLAVAGAWSMPIDGLPCPDPEDDDRAEAFDAVRLFIRAARRIEPAFAPSGEMAAIVEICRRVDGLPLALELAAAWVRVLPCAAIAAELRQGTELLRADDASHPPRHGSIAVVFEQSWQRLTEAERDALAGLSVFRGGFTAEAARAVAGASLPILGALADKSLLRKDAARLHLHPLVQQLAALRLEARPRDVHEARQAAHAAYFHHWLKRQAPAVADGEGLALQAIDIEFENCRQAWLCSTARGDANALMDSVAILLDYCDYRGRCEEGLALLEQAIASPRGQSDTRLQARLLSKSAHLLYRLDRYPEAQAAASRALAWSRRDPATRAQATTVLASCSLRLGRLTDARRFYTLALALTPPQELAHHTAAMLDNLALVEKRLGHYDEALRLSLESLARHRQIGDSAGVALCLNNLASLYQVRRAFDTAEVHLREALAICERDGLAGTLGFILANLTEVALKTGDTSSAEHHAARGVEVVRPAGNRLLLAWLTAQSARIAARRGDVAAARTVLAEAIGISLAVNVPTLQADGLLGFVEVLEAQGEFASARRVLQFVVDHPEIDAAERAELEGELARRAPPAVAGPAWPGLALPELLHRIVVETGVAYAPLLNDLRPPR